MADRDDEHRVEPASGASTRDDDAADAIHDDDELAEALARQLERFAPSGPIPVQRQAPPAGRVLRQPPIPAGERPVAAPPVRRGGALPARPVVSPVLRPVRPLRPETPEPALRPVARIHPGVAEPPMAADPVDDEAGLREHQAAEADAAPTTPTAASAPVRAPDEPVTSAASAPPVAPVAADEVPSGVERSEAGPGPAAATTAPAVPGTPVPPDEAESVADLQLALDPADFRAWATSLQTIGRDGAPQDAPAWPDEVVRFLDHPGADATATDRRSSDDGTAATGTPGSEAPSPSAEPDTDLELPAPPSVVPAPVTAPVLIPRPVPVDAGGQKPVSFAFVQDADDEIPVTTGELAAFDSGAVATGSIPLIAVTDPGADDDDDDWMDDARTDMPAKPAGLVRTGEMPVLVAGRPATGAIPIVAVPFTPAGRAAAEPHTVPVDAELVDAVPVEKQASGFWQIGVWAAVGTGAPAILAGGALVVAGLSLLQAVVAVVLGALVHGVLTASPVAFGSASGRGGDALIARTVGTVAVRGASSVVAVLRVALAAGALWVVGRAAGRWSLPLDATGTVDPTVALVALLLAALVVGALAGAPSRAVARTLTVLAALAVAAAGIVLGADAGAAGLVASAGSASSPLGAVVSGAVLVAAVGGFGVVGAGADVGRRARSGALSGSAAFLGAVLPVVLLGGFGVLATAPASSVILDGLTPTGTSTSPSTALALLVLAVVAPVALATIASASAARAVRVAAPSLPAGGAVAIVVLVAVGTAAALAALDLPAGRVLPLLLLAAVPAAALAGAHASAVLLRGPALRLHVPALVVLLLAVVVGAGLTDGLGAGYAEGWLYAAVGADPATRPALAGPAVALVLGALAPLLPSRRRTAVGDATAGPARRSVDSAG